MARPMPLRGQRDSRLGGKEKVMKRKVNTPCFKCGVQFDLDGDRHYVVEKPCCSDCYYNALDEITMLPEGYTRKTNCCMRCKHLCDRSRPNGLSLYCNINKDAPVRPNKQQITSKAYHIFSEIEIKWEVPHSVEAWGVCPKWEQREGECKHGRIGYCTDCYFNEEQSQDVKKG